MAQSGVTPEATAQRVLIAACNLTLGAGGMEKTAVNVANHLNRSGRSVCFAYAASEDDTPIYPLDDGVARARGSFGPEWLAQVATEFRADVIVFFYSHWNEAKAVAALTETGIPVVLHEGSNPGRVVRDNWARRRGISVEQAEEERLALMAMCTRLRFTIPEYRDSLPELVRRDSVAFPNAFPPADPEHIALRGTAPRKSFINVGGMKPVKNVMAAVEAFSMIADKLPDWDFVIFSALPRRTDVPAKLDAFVAANGLQGRVFALPPTPRISEEYGRAQVHVVASKQEGLPNCVAEASRHGLPSIGFACCPGTNSMIVHERNGLLAQCDDDEIEDLAAQMLRMAQNDAEREAFGQAALAESFIYDPETVFGHWDQVIDDAFRDSPSREELLRRRFPDRSEANRIRLIQRTVLGSQSLPPPKPAEAAPVLSIIVPIFNKEDYIEATLRSIRDAVYEPKEVILVDDLSTDRSGLIAAKFADENGWTLVRHDRNQGLSAARNSGLEAATGEYVHFWDADDLYHPTGSAEIVGIMREHGSDIGTGLASRDGELHLSYRKAFSSPDPVNFARIPAAFTTASTCFKIYRRGFLNDHGLRFVPGLYMQDSEFNMRAFPLAERISTTAVVIGEYLQIEGSGARSFHWGRFQSALDIADLTRDFYGEHDLRDLELHRQRHVLEIVWPGFLRRATFDYHAISVGTNPGDLHFEFLNMIQQRLNDMSEGILHCRLPNLGRHVALFAIREGYYNWLPGLMRRRYPPRSDVRLMARNGAEKRLLDSLLDGAYPA